MRTAPLGKKGKLAGRVIEDRAAVQIFRDGMLVRQRLLEIRDRLELLLYVAHQAIEALQTVCFLGVA